MIGYLVIILISINTIMIIRKKNSSVISLLSLICIWLIMGLNTYTDDYPGYMNLYNSQIIGLTMEPGFTLMTVISHRLGFSYDQFLAIFIMITLIVGVVAARKVTNNYHVVICLFVLTALCVNVDEIRQFFSYVLYALALVFLTDDKRGKLKYAITICLASTIQVSSIVLLPFPFIFGKLKNRKSVLRVYFGLIALFCIVVFINGNKIPFLVEIISLVIPENKLVYFQTKTNMGFLLFFMANFLNLTVAYYAMREVNRNEQNYSEKEHKFINNLYDSILYLSFAMPLCMINSEFLRFFRFSVIPCIFAIAITFNKIYFIRLRSNRRGAMIVGKADFMFILYVIGYQICMQNWRIVEQVIQNNVLN